MQLFGLTQRIAQSCLKWAARLLAFFFVIRFVLAIPSAMIGTDGLLSLLDPILLLAAALLLIGLLATSRLTIATIDGVSSAFSTAIAGMLILIGITFLYLSVSWSGILDPSGELSMGTWAARIYALIWLLSLVSLGLFAWWSYSLYRLSYLRGITAISWMAGMGALTLTWFSHTSFGVHYLAPFAFLGLGGLGLAYGITQLRVLIEQGTDVATSNLD